MDEKLKNMVVDAESDKQPDIEEIKKAKAKKLRAELPEWVFVDPNTAKTKVIVQLLGDAIVKKNKLLYVTNDKKEKLYSYNSETGIWVVQPESYLRDLAHKPLKKYAVWADSVERQTINYLKGEIPKKTLEKTINKVPTKEFNFKNGVFDWDKMQLLPHSAKHYFTTVSGIELDTNNTTTPETDKYFKLLFKENAKTVKEFVGWMFYPSYKEIQAYIILKATGGEGKSTFVNWLTSLVGEENTANIPLNALTDKKANKFKASELQYKYLNTHADIPDVPIYNSANLKSLTGDDRQNADKKNEKDANFKNFAKFLWCANKLPSFKDNSKGMGRRPFIIDFYKINNYKDVINWDAIKKERGAFTYKCILLAKKAIKRGNLTETDSIQKERKDWLSLNDPISVFLADCTTTVQGNELDFIEFYNVYCNWCLLNGFEYMDSSHFRDELKDNHGLKKDQHKPHGKPRWYFVPNIELTTDISRVHPNDRFKNEPTK